MPANAAAAVVLFQGVPPQALVLAMLLCYAMCFAGLIFAYLAHRRRAKQQREKEADRRRES